jgi:serine/threonine-protein kinase RsbW
MSSATSHGKAQRIELKIASNPAAIAGVRRRVEALARQVLAEPAVGEVGLCLNEALANVMRHAYEGATDRPIVVTAELDGESLSIAIRDWGNGVNPLDLPVEHYNPLAPGGVGMLCLRKLMDGVEFLPQERGMLLVMKRSKAAKS